MAELGARTGREKNQAGFRFTYIGIEANLFEGTLAIKPQRLVKLQGKFGRAAYDATARYTRHELLSMAGNTAYISTHSAGALVFARGLYAAAGCARSRRGVVALAPETRQDIKAMLTCIMRMSYLTICPKLVAYVESDASGIHGAGGALSAAWLHRIRFLHFPFPRAFLLHGNAEIDESIAEILHGGQKASSGLLEMYAATVTILTFRELLRGSTVVLCTDSTATVHAITKMYSPKPRTAQLLKYLAALVVSHDITIAPVHRPREMLAHVDALSHYDEVKFRSLVPDADLHATPVEPRVLSFLLDPTCLHETADVFGLL